MDRLGTAKKVLEHLGLKWTQLPDYLMDDKNKRTQLVEEDTRILAHFEEDTLWTLKTVRFLKDFQRYGAGIHFNTSNKSFKRTAELFRGMGIKNYYFMLQLNNPMLQDVDPWDPNLDDVTRAMILAECNENIWYIIREVVMIGGRRFRGNRAVLSFMWACLCHIPTTILMPRQSGKQVINSGKIKLSGSTGEAWTTHGTVKVGDKVLAWDGTETSVIGVYPQGTRDVYKCIFVDDRSVVVGGEHLWTVWDPGKGRRGKWRTLTTLEVMERQAELAPKGHNNLSVPLPKPDQTTPDKDLPVNPYLVGVLIGDGCLSTGSVVYCKPDDELFKRIAGALPPGHVVVHRPDGKNKVIIKGPHFDKTKHVYIKHSLDEIGLMGKRWDTKRIPEQYLNASHNQRRALLQGLMDTDGTAEQKGNTYYCTSNKELAEDVLYLARSLGHIAHITDREFPKYKYKGETLIGAHAYRVNIRACEPWDLFRDPKRSARVENCKRGLKFNSRLAFKSIEKLPEQEECTCIEVDHPDHLYITDDFIVTHNTVGMQVLAFIMQYFVGRGYRTGLITLAASNRMQFVEAIKKIRAGLPEYLINVTYKDKDAGNMLSYEAFGVEFKNTFEVRVPSGGADGAENVSRGSTFESLLYDEPAWTKYIENIINGSGPATLTAQKEAREKGIPYFTAKATTPNSVLKEEGRFMHQDFMDSTEWREAFFDSFSETHLVKRLIKASPVSNVTFPKLGMMFTHLQLGLGHAWVKETMDKLGLSWSKAKIDLLMMWTEEGESKLFDDFTREKLNESKEDPVWNEEVNETGLFIDWFVTKDELDTLINDPDEYFFMGMDTSDANNRDAMTLVMRRAKTGENIGTGRYPLAFADDVTEVLKELLIRIPNSLLLIERNRAAHMIERLLLTLPAYGIDPFRRIFNDIIQDPIKYKNEYKDVNEIHFKHRSKEFYLRFKRFFGFYTGPQTRREMYGFIHEAVSLTGAGIRFKLLVDELIGLEINKEGRIDHGNKTHDDLVVAWLLSYWFIKLGYNKQYYGIPQGMIMTQIVTLKNNGDAPQYTKNQLEMFIKIKSRINDLTKELMQTTNNMIAERIEMEVRKLSDFIPKEMKKTITIDNILEEAKAERTKRAVAKRTRFSGSVRYR